MKKFLITVVSAGETKFYTARAACGIDAVLSLGLDFPFDSRVTVRCMS